MTFPVSGVETPLWLPPLVAFGISFFTSMGGVSGAFLLLPFQVSVLGFTSPAVSPTNHIFNVVAIPSGVLRYVREGRMIWPLTCIVVVGTVPGVFLGGWIRLVYLPDPGPFKAFVGCVLLYIGVQLLQDIVRSRRALERPAPTASEDWTVHVSEFSARRLAFRFQDADYACSTVGVGLMSLAVGLVGGIYGIGGGAIIAPVFVVMYRLPVHVVAGATLLGTFVTSAAAVLFFQFVGPHLVTGNEAVTPDWLLGVLFGAGGMAGMYLGARAQRFVPATAIKVLLCLVLVVVAVRYLAVFLLS
ncbi:MAG: sulfite exporter TauE/SafE family protein [bacterium]|nr:sulfite exporter TauE/SafE family protein [bacterium]